MAVEIVKLIVSLLLGFVLGVLVTRITFICRGEYNEDDYDRQ